MTRTNTKMI